MPTNYLRWEGTRRGQRWEKPTLALLALVILASGARAWSSFHRHHLAVKHCKRGETAWCRGRIAEAEREFRAALKSDPYLFAARDQLSILAWQRGDSERAVALLREGVRLHPDLAEAHRALGETLFLLRDFAGAVPVLERAEQLEPTEPGRPSLLATCRQALAAPPRGARQYGTWNGPRPHATMHRHADGDHACSGH